MSVVLLIVFFLCAVECRVAKSNQYFTDYLNKEATVSIKGIFLLLVFLGHLSQYISLEGEFDSFYVLFKKLLAQLVVALFLFYSGYGVMESIKKRGAAYVRQIPIKRILKVLLHFDIAVVLFVLYHLLMGHSVDWKKVALSFITWESIGNSNWYILAVLSLYLISFLSFIVFRKYYYLGAVCVTALSVVVILLLTASGRPAYYYNTMLCYSAGVWYSLIKTKMDSILCKNDLSYLAVLIFVLICYCYFFLHRYEMSWFYQMWAVTFSIVIVFLTLKIRFHNGLIYFIGDHLFPIYILQRLPMMYLSEKFHVNKHVFLFVLLSLLLTLLMALIYDYFVGKLDQFLFSRDKRSGKCR